MGSGFRSQVHNQVTDSKRTKRLRTCGNLIKDQLLLGRVLELRSEGSNVGCATTRLLPNTLMVTKLTVSAHSVGFVPSSQDLAFSFPLKPEIFLREGRVLRTLPRGGQACAPFASTGGCDEERQGAPSSQLPSSRRAPSSIFRTDSSKL